MARTPLGRKVLGALARAARDVAGGGDRGRGSAADRAEEHAGDGRSTGGPGGPAQRHDPRRGELPTPAARPQVAYAPVRDGDADPGEVVWAWVPFEEDPSQGKDRPLLVIGHLGEDVAALSLTSRPRDDRHHLALGSGTWDRDGRDSWVALDRLVRLDPDDIRREGAVLDRSRFDQVVAAWEAYDG